MNIILKSDKKQTIKELLKSKHFSPKLISILEKEGLYTLDTINKDEEINIKLIEKRNDFYIEDINLNIVYEDDYILVINKPKNLSSIPSIKHYYHNLSNMVMNYYIKNNICSNIHPINRLDYKTSGLIIFAKHRYIHNLFNNIEINKYYKALVNGIFPINEGYINLPIYDNESIKREINEKGKSSLTYFKIKEIKDNTTLLDIKLYTGRTHQIRCHLSYLGYPIIGDNLYGKEEEYLQLECYKIDFIHPINKKRISIEI